MLFNSLHFVLYFPIVTIIYFLLKHESRWIWLLAASCYFYMAFVPEFILILAGTIVIDYFAAFWIDKSKGRERKIALALSIVANVGILAVFKYYNFMVDNLTGVFELFGQSYEIPYLSMILPIGLSFHTFQAMSYTIEVYYGRYKPEKHFGIYSLYVMFYPQLVAGPIERPQNLLSQYHEKKKLDLHNVSSGLRLMLWGLFKKVVIADRLEMVTSKVFNNPGEYHNWEAIVAACLFSYQLYCDFSGYSDIAIGSARVMGFDLMKNFNLPFNSKSVRELWTRWHISLNTWFKDYLYIPMGGSRVPFPRMLFNITIVFALSGLWHGSSWNYIIFGLINAFFVVTGYFARPVIEKFLRSIPIPGINTIVNYYFVLTTFLSLTLSFVFFRASTFEGAITLLSNMGNWNNVSMNLPLSGYSGLASALIAIVVLEVLQYIYAAGLYHKYFFKLPFVARAIVYNIIIFAILSFGVFEEFPFYYFQF